MENAPPAPCTFSGTPKKKKKKREEILVYQRRWRCIHKAGDSSTIGSSNAPPSPHKHSHTHAGPPYKVEHTRRREYSTHTYRGWATRASPPGYIQRPDRSSGGGGDHAHHLTSPHLGGIFSRSYRNGKGHASYFPEFIFFCAPSQPSFSLVYIHR